MTITTQYLQEINEQHLTNTKLFSTDCLFPFVMRLSMSRPTPQYGAKVGDYRGFAQTGSQKPQGGAKLAMQIPY